jgi:hypothetical protein
MSGKRTDKLYGRIAAITAIRTGMANVLVVNTLDRSSRSMADGAKLVADAILVSKVWPNTPAVTPKAIRYLQQNSGVPLDHPRRCVAHTHAGQPCRRYAARGGNVCRVHGGAAPQVVAKARERLSLAADIMARTLLGIAESAESEAVKLAAVKDALDRAGVPAKAEVAIELKPWEQLMCDIVGIATLPRDEHGPRQPALVEPAEVIDAELVDPDAEGDPEIGPNSSTDALRTPDRADLPGADSASSMAPVALPPVSASYEDAPAVMRAA